MVNWSTNSLPTPSVAGQKKLASLLTRNKDLPPCTGSSGGLHLNSVSPNITEAILTLSLWLNLSIFPSVCGNVLGSPALKINGYPPPVFFILMLKPVGSSSTDVTFTGAPADSTGFVPVNLQISVPDRVCWYRF